MIFNSSNTPNIIHPIIPPDLKPLIPVSGFDISELRVAYDPTNDALDIGFGQPPAMQPNQPGPVIAGDADDNGNAGTVNPAVSAADPGFTEFPALGGPERFAAFLSLTGNGIPDVVAGFSPTNTTVPKPYEVATAIPNPANPQGEPTFGTDLPNNTGNVYLFNSPAHPNLEIQISHFSQLYLQETGHALTPQSTIQIGAFAGSPDTIRISDAFFPSNSFTIQQASPTPTPTPTPTPCPPVSPPIKINPHLNRHINTAHPTDVRVTVFGTSGFDVTQIIPSTVTFGGAHPIFAYPRFVGNSQFLDETFVFKGTDVNLPPGIIDAPISGVLRNGTTFVSSERVFNRNDSFYSAGAVESAQARQANTPNKIATPLARLAERLNRTEPGVSPYLPSTTRAAAVSQPAVAVAVPAANHASSLGGPVVSIKRRQPVVHGAKKGGHVSSNLQASMNAYINSSTGTATTAAAGAA